MAKGPVVADDPESAVPGLQQGACGLHHALQHGVQAEVFGQGDHRFQQARHSFL
ncbi:hypothetical protein [Arthrobacter sp. PAMC25284]|uniref:hypothetical protein n=1 Tax=Arthrobacter sp. PAMC25284 TaxID=2861279 RepID=UPI00280B3430|nr:hypothetical protein [Arthrobacter sp. PAMC25284]